MKITNEDNMELMARYEDNYFDLAIVDPPYGIGFDGGHKPTQGKSGKSNTFNKEKILYKKGGWDNKRPHKEYFTELQRVSKNQIIWGGNYFADLLAPKKGWIYWDKKITNANNKNYSDGELAYTSFDCILRKYTYDWIGFGYLNNPKKQKKIHPTEKPISLYEWLLINYAKEGDKILDTHLGSGSIAIACHNLGYDLTACELDKDYFNDAMKRIEDHKKQLRMF
jgi:site-specific DNA-methyltransferase (adenine-specific)